MFVFVEGHNIDFRVTVTRGTSGQAALLLRQFSTTLIDTMHGSLLWKFIISASCFLSRYHQVCNLNDSCN